MMEDVGTSANQLIQLDSNAKIPAVDGSLLTGLGAASGSSDPTISTNPSGGVGTKFINTTDGEIFICTDATAGENVWKNVGAGSGDVAPAYWVGKNYGYMMGAAPGPLVNVIQKFSFTSSSDAVDVADMTWSRGFLTGNSSATYGYASGGGTSTPGQNLNVIDKHQFGTTNNSTDVGDLLAGKQSLAGANSETYGFLAGGYPANNTVQKISFSTDGNTTDHGDLTGTRSAGCGMNSETHGYNSGGSGASQQRDKYAFASNVTAVDDGDHFAGHHSYANGISSGTHGYVVGGNISGAGGSDVIDKFSFAAGGDSTDVGDLTNAGYKGAGISQTDHGYKGGTNGTPDNNRIEKFTFASDNDSVDTGNSMLTQGSANQSCAYGASAQY